MLDVFVLNERRWDYSHGIPHTVVVLAVFFGFGARRTQRNCISEYQFGFVKC